MKGQRRIGDDMGNEHREPEVGDLAPEFIVEAGDGRVALSNLAGRREKLILMSQDSYQYHPN
jgi:hypothetical protein